MIAFLQGSDGKKFTKAKTTIMTSFPMAFSFFACIHIDNDWVEDKNEWEPTSMILNMNRATEILKNDLQLIVFILNSSQYWNWIIDISQVKHQSIKSFSRIIERERKRERTNKTKYEHKIHNYNVPDISIPQNGICKSL